MADKLGRLPPFTLAGVRVVPYYGGPSLRSWRIDVRGQRGMDVSDEVLAELGRLSQNGR